MASFIVFFLLFFLPFIIAPFGVTQFETPKVVFAEIAIIILFLVLLFSNKISFRNHTNQIVIYCSILIVTAIDFFFLKTPLSFFGNAFRMQGIFLLWMLLLFSFLSSRQEHRLFEKIPWWVYSILLYAEVLITFCLPLNASHRYVGTLGEPNAMAAFAIFLWPFGWFAVRNNKSEILSKVLLLLPVCILLYLSGSRSGMIAFGIEVGYIVLQKYIPSLKKTVWICVILYFLSYLFPFFEHTPYENRVEVWQSAFYAGVINPGLGQGFGNTEIALHNAAAGLSVPVQYYYVDSSHNIFLDWWVQGGVIGVSLLVLLVSNAFISFEKQQNKRELVLLFGMLIVLSFNPASIVGLLGFWWILGRSFSFEK
ncbi:MAG TPA: O-antigen ligase family protein [Candidatus Saccharimonadales bacterium]|nr:O-antigen ligase family protein [Candidatus Saccharimonadales bacterium]